MALFNTNVGAGTNPEVLTDTVSVGSTELAVNLGGRATMLGLKDAGGQLQSLYVNGDIVFGATANYTITITNTGFTAKYNGSGTASVTYYAIL